MQKLNEEQLNKLREIYLVGEYYMAYEWYDFIAYAKRTKRFNKELEIDDSEEQSLL